MFLGEFQHSLDAKGRVILPVRFREQLEGGAVMARALDGCLVVYPLAEFDRVARKLQEVRERGARERQAARAFFAGAVEFTPDKQGRVAVPQNLRDVRAPRARGRRGRQLRPHRDLGCADGSPSATRPASHRSSKAKASTSSSDRKSIRRKSVVFDNTTGPDVPGSSSAPRPARLLAPTPPAFSRSRLGETSRAVPVDRGAEDGIGSDHGQGERRGMDEEEEFSHLPVMAREVVELLLPVPAGLIVDCTVGGGGHSTLLLDARPDVHLLGLDRDADAVEAARSRLARFGDRAQGGARRIRTARGAGRAAR